MLTLAGRQGLWVLALGSLLLGVVPCAGAEEGVDPTTLPNLKPASTGAPAAETEAVSPSADDHVSPSKQVPDHSHRRRAVVQHASPKSSRRPYPAAVSELPIERLRRSATGDVDVPHPALIDRAPLAELIKRMAGWTDSCPVCGKSCPLCGKAEADQDQDLADLVAQPKASTDRQMLGQLGREKAGDEASSRPLQAGEPAQVILDTQRRLGKSVLEGTEFGGSPEVLIQWIRALDEETRRQQAMLEEVSRADVDEVEEEVSTVTGQSQIEALRNACRQMQEAADLLEEQNLFESADSVRQIADGLRRRSRQKVGDLEACRTSPRLTERVQEREAEDEEGGRE